MTVNNHSYSDTQQPRNVTRCMGWGFFKLRLSSWQNNCNKNVFFFLQDCCFSTEFVYSAIASYNLKSFVPSLIAANIILGITYLLSYILTYLINYLITPWSRDLLEKLTGFQLSKKFPAFYGTRNFITAFTSARHLSLYW